MVSLRVQVDRKQLERLARLGGDVVRAVVQGIDRLLLKVQAEITMELRGGALKNRSGGFVNSWVAPAVDKTLLPGSPVFGSLGSRHPAARIHETGGTIVPKQARYLAIPLAAAKTPAGVARYSSPRRVSGLVLRRSRAGNLLLVKLPEAEAKRTAERPRATRRGTGRIPPIPPGAVPYFLLRERVVLPPRRYLSRAAQRTAKSAAGIMRATIQEGIARANR